ncbi:hypothetical protein BN2497_14419 [Janthinobacterium sp. CG23_2]|nr:hypothetical protein BN2497_10507 [Janthinobacterium sp. CG23_2]CUI09821.1 hypothetical protein BN2497_14419 [Janthinobacterium sp. CG23_2]CUU31651.1 hypothetical protein BN3177_10507 [Janthinobacterium sp. CG23_2]CUU33607.1 hypothetical protein BN3177_14419 [Janthinobacterium sp. CG23_2]
MTERTITCTLTVHRAWWLMPYMHTLDFICAVTGMEPDMKKVRRMIERGLTLKAKPAR